MKCRHILLIVAIGILGPVVVNLILLCHNPFPIIEVVGDRVNWLAFYGSYVGGIATFAMAYITVRITKQQIIAEHKRDRLNYVRTDLARLFSVEFMYDIFAKVASGNMENNEEEQYRQLMLWSHFQSLQHSAELNYNTIKSTDKEKEFYIAYFNFLEHCKSLSSGQVIALFDKENKLAKFYTLSKVMDMDKEYSRLFQVAKEKAKQLIIEMENECNNIIIF